MLPETVSGVTVLTCLSTSWIVETATMLPCPTPWLAVGKCYCVDLADILAGGLQAL